MSKELNDIEKNISELSKTLEKLTKDIAPILNISDLGKNIDKLKNSIPKVETEEDPDDSDNTTNEGETCMHGNSWNSECSDCGELGLVDHLFSLVEQYPDDSDLGKQVREIYNYHQKLTDNTEE